jgi:hypothetical protein
MKSEIVPLYILSLISVVLFSLLSCAPEIGQVVIARPDEYRHTYEAREKIILVVVARVFQEKSMGSNVRIDWEKQQVETDFIIQGGWRTRSRADIRKLNWKESEVVLSVITEKKTAAGCEMRRLLDAEQYINLFDTIDLAIYEEMSKIE